MRKFLFIVSLWFAAASLAAAAETLSLTDGGSVAGDIIKFDDNGIMLKTPEETYTNVSWGRFSQASLKQLAGNPKIKFFAEPFIDPDPKQHSQKEDISINKDIKNKLNLPTNRRNQPKDDVNSPPKMDGFDGRFNLFLMSLLIEISSFCECCFGSGSRNGSAKNLIFGLPASCFKDACEKRPHNTLV